VGLAEGLAVVLAVGVGVALEVAAFVGNAVNTSNSAMTMPNARLIAIPLKFAD
jgi:ABC-type nickel/cobalt efflux system permease component RcnA